MATEVKQSQYCNSLTEYKRWKTREVDIGGLPLGGNNPVRIQSMTTANTRDTEGTVAESIRLIEAGSEYVRITAPSKRDAKNLENIKQELRAKGYNTPLVADIHFTPNAAEIAAEVVEKVRVNPGNYADKKKFEVYEYSDDDYEEELNRIRKKFTPLVRLCKEHGRAMRIGTNHGSLSDRIMSRYGDTPLGMVESAMEFLRICEDEEFYDIVLSMKASNPQVMVQAYRLLVATMKEHGMNYPLHLGVTEAGDGEDARIKSAVGIGTLLEDGLGDTIRVSLTEKPEAELPVARMLADRYNQRNGHEPIDPVNSVPLNPYEFVKRETIPVSITGGEQVPVVMADLSDRPKDNPLELKGYGYHYDVPMDQWSINDFAVDYVYLGNEDVSYHLPGTLRKVLDAGTWEPQSRGAYPLFTAAEFLEDRPKSTIQNFVVATIHDFTMGFLETVKQDPTVTLVLRTDNNHAMPELRRAFFKLMEYEVKNPVVIKREYRSTNADQFTLYSATDVGGLLIDGMGDGIWLTGEGIFQKKLNDVSFGILQASRTRISKTDYISCPSCGRTLFDLEETTAMIRQATNHLKGVKIAIMGCIVNGPGEMADADYGYVGSGPGKITLYKGKEVVKKGIPTEHALDELVKLLRDNGDWVETEEQAGTS